jgi:hypothetical protein
LVARPRLSAPPTFTAVQPGQPKGIHMLKNVVLHITEPGRGTLEVEGHPLKGIVGISLTHRVTEFARLTVELVMHEIEVDGQMQVMVPEKTRDSLVALGWVEPYAR